MTTDFKQKVDQLFAKVYDPNSDFCENPVTGEHFVPRLDPVRPRKQYAIRALQAQARFAEEKPADMPDLPLHSRKDEDLKWQSPRNFLVGAYADSLRCRDFRLEGHPDFETFARGLMASPWTPEEFRNDPELLRRYPPKPLKGLRPGLVF